MIPLINAPEAHEEEVEILSVAIVGVNNNDRLAPDCSYATADHRKPGTRALFIVEYKDPIQAFPMRSIITDGESFYHIYHIPVSENVNMNIEGFVIGPWQNLRIPDRGAIRNAIEEMVL